MMLYAFGMVLYALPFSPHLLDGLQNMQHKNE